MKRFDGFMHGVNLGGWLSQCDYSEDRLNNFIKEEDIKTIAGWGLDHVRLPVDFNIFENNDGSRKEDGYVRVANAIGWCKKYNLNMILDVHKNTRTVSTTSGKILQKHLLQHSMEQRTKSVLNF